jgi:hypothetical protein
MRKFLGAAIALLLLPTVTFAAPAAKPKATGDADLTNNDAYNTQANLTFNAINTGVTGFEAKGSAIYTDPNVTYTMDVQYLRVSDHTAWFMGKVTSVAVTGTSTGCCAPGNWILYKVVDVADPGINADQIWGEDLTQGEGISDPASAYLRFIDPTKPMGGPFVITGGNIQVH